MLRCWICYSLRFSSSFSFCYLLLFATAVTVSGLTCPHPCDPATTCSEVDTSNCQHGIVKDVCECCDVCGLGPGGDCTLEKCGPEYECVRIIPDSAPAGYPFTEQQRLELPGVCRQRVLPPIPAPEPTTPAPVDSSNATTTDCESSGDEDALMMMMSGHMCRPKCSIDFCNERQSPRICSARGMQMLTVRERNDCQHTSCYSCYIMVRPPCENVTCPEPPNKKCLREFNKCVIDHYHYAVKSNRPLFMRINDPRAKLYPGKLFCDVPEVIRREAN